VQTDLLHSGHTVCGSIVLPGLAAICQARQGKCMILSFAVLQTVGMDTAQRAAGAVVSLVDGGPPPAPGPPDGITTTLAGMSKAQLYEILAQMKGLIQQNPAQARQILVTSPQLAKALFQVRRVAWRSGASLQCVCTIRIRHYMLITARLRPLACSSLTLQCLLLLVWADECD
jgi:Hinge domain of cleavage stimulation factor subunit 2